MKWEDSKRKILNEEILHWGSDFPVGWSTDLQVTVLLTLAFRGARRIAKQYKVSSDDVLWLLLNAYRSRYKKPAKDRDCAEYVEWRNAVYSRDVYTCQKCEECGGNLNAHHIEAYNNNPKFRMVIANGVTLCKICHVDFHHQYGYGSNSKEQLQEWLLAC